MPYIEKEEKLQLVAKRTGQQRDNQNKKGKSTVNCKYCGLSNERDKEKCPAWGKTCRSYGKKNHYAKVCTSRGDSNRRQAHSLETGDLYIGTIAKEIKVNTVESSEEVQHHI
ncbi:Hypothetical predicted protein [Paramuricea clavata]|uniref:Uncharacterized protein n=1 Tax=Paramuricea clavata TaxID=317549 RepID=A0A6S7HCT3_PARCT|nr:Hypothetical predicted protein [Paramuricea clavata]